LYALNSARRARVRPAVTPSNAKRLLYALEDNIRKFDEQAKGAKITPFDNLIPPIGGIKGEA
jgi:hypothetical protein